MRATGLRPSASFRAAGALAFCAGLVGAGPAAACSVCYGAADGGSPLITGARLGVFLILGVTATVLASFAKFFFYLRNRARQTEVEQIASEWDQLQRSSST